jgi:hypothetical protein
MNMKHIMVPVFATLLMAGCSASSDNSVADAVPTQANAAADEKAAVERVAKDTKDTVGGQVAAVMALMKECEEDTIRARDGLNRARGGLNAAEIVDSYERFKKAKSTCDASRRAISTFDIPKNIPDEDQRSLEDATRNECQMTMSYVSDAVGIMEEVIDSVGNAAPSKIIEGKEDMSKASEQNQICAAKLAKITQKYGFTDDEIDVAVKHLVP